jgi:hypothetical protein
VGGVTQLAVVEADDSTVHGLGWVAHCETNQMTLWLDPGVELTDAVNSLLAPSCRPYWVVSWLADNASGQEMWLVERTG